MSLVHSPSEIVERAEASGDPGLLGRNPAWPRVDLSQLVRIQNGTAFKSHFFNTIGDGLPLIRIRDVGRDASTTWYSGDFDPDFIVNAGDLLVGMDGDFRVAVWHGPDGLLNQRVSRLTVVDDRLDGRWLQHVLQGYLDAIWAETSSITVKHLSSRTIGQIPIPLPPVAEQHRIVEALEDHLSRLDAGDEYLQAVLERLKNMGRASLDQHFGRREVPLADLIEDITAGKSFGGANSAAREDEWGIVKVSAMTWGEFIPTENKAVNADLVDPRFEIREGDLLVSRANTVDYVGASVLVAQVRPKLLLSDKSLRVTPRAGISARWLWRALQAPSARRQISELATGTKDSMRNISQESLRRVRLPAADGAEQADAIRAYDEIDGAIRRVWAEIAVSQNRSRALRRSLLRAAFNGELVDQDSSDQSAQVALERLRTESKPVRKRAMNSSAAAATQS